jgi:hypothetical protein
LGNLEEDSSTADFERWMKRLYEEAPWRGSGGAPSLGTLEDVLGKSLYGGPFPFEGNLVCEGACTPGTLLDGWRRVLVVGHLPVRDSMKGTMEGGLPYQGARKMVFLIDLQDSL